MWLANHSLTCLTSLVNIYIEDNSIWVQVAATLRELYYWISKKRKIHGFPTRICPTVGVGGHTSGGVYGNMLRKYVLAVNNCH